MCWGFDTWDRDALWRVFFYGTKTSNLVTYILKLWPLSGSHFPVSYVVYWQLLLHFCDYLPYEDDLALYWNKLEFPSPKDNLYQVWLNLASWFWKRRFFRNFQCIFTLSLFPFIWTNLNLPSLQGWFMPCLFKIGQVVLEKKILKDPTPFLYAHRKTGRIMLWFCPSVHLSMVIFSFPDLFPPSLLF
jgi:hypothetical protein